LTMAGIQLCNMIDTSSFTVHIHPVTTYVVTANTVCHHIKILNSYLMQLCQLC
jgi:hypothetical protein